MLRVRRIEPGEGHLLKRLRLAALEDSPDAFGSTLEAESGRPDAEWGARAVVGSNGSARMTAFAEGAQGVIGLVGGYREATSSTTVELVSMWVSPNARRAGVGRILVAAVLDWARDTGASEVALWVTEGNTAAERLYAAMGFAETEAARAAPSNSSRTEVRMVMPVN